MADGQPQIIIGGNTPGFHNADVEAAARRVMRSKAYRDVSTVCVIPTRGMVHASIIESWFGLMVPMNQKFVRIFIAGMEVGEAYNSAVEMILGHPDLSQFKYMLTMEEDNMPPPDGLIRLIEAMNEERHYAAIGGLYWTKGEGGMPMIYGARTYSLWMSRVDVPIDPSCIFRSFHASMRADLSRGDAEAKAPRSSFFRSLVNASLDQSWDGQEAIWRQGMCQSVVLASEMHLAAS